MKLNVKLLIASIVAGLVAGIAAVALYQKLEGTMSNRILIPLLFVAFAVILCATVSIWMACFGKGEEAFWFLEGRMMLTIGLVCGLVVLFFSSMLLEWLYDTDFQDQPPSTSYIFVLDESGSMGGNDPSLKRYSAVQDMMDNMAGDLPYAVYMFADSCKQIRPMGDVAQGTVSRPADAEYTVGVTTYIRNALETVLKDIQNGRLVTGGAPHVILLTDGYANDMTAYSDQTVLRKLVNEGARVSTVGLGMVDNDLMQWIADKTGGAFLMVDDAADLAQGFTDVATMNSYNNLLSFRTGVRTSVLYLVLRVLFLLVLGAVVGCLKGIACGQDFLLILLVTVAGALLGAVVMEVCHYFGSQEFIPQLIYWILLSATPGQEKLPTYRTSRGSMQIQSSVVTHAGKGASSSRGRIEW